MTLHSGGGVGETAPRRTQGPRMRALGGRQFGGELAPRRPAPSEPWGRTNSDWSASAPCSVIGCPDPPAVVLSDRETVFLPRTHAHQSSKGAVAHRGRRVFGAARAGGRQIPTLRAGSSGMVLRGSPRWLSTTPSRRAAVSAPPGSRTVTL